MLCCVVLFSPLLQAEEASGYRPPPDRQDGWPVQDLRGTAADLSQLNQLLRFLDAQPHRIDSMVLAHRGQLVFEDYYHQADWQQPHDLRSVTKSIRSLLVGIAIDQGHMQSEDEPFLTYLNSHQVEKNQDPRKSNITLQHLLSMRSGLACHDWDKKSPGQEDRVYKKKDWLQYTLNLPMAHEPGAVTHYCSLGTFLAAETINQASGIDYARFAHEQLFSPLGIENFRWGHTSRKKNIRPAAKRLYMTTRDLAKVGQLVLQQGRWQQRQVVSTAWLTRSTSAHTQLAGTDYGLGWWLIPFQAGDETYQAISATGNGGQYLFVIPSLDLVAAFTGSAYNSDEGQLPLAVMKDIFIPTIQSLSNSP